MTIRSVKREVGRVGGIARGVGYAAAAVCMFYSCCVVLLSAERVFEEVVEA